MRITYSLKNISIGLLSQIVLVLLGFLSRKVFLDSLGTEYLGVNAVLTSVLSMLSLVEAGIGASIIYHLYKPLAERDTQRIIALVQLYKKAYWILALIITALSVGLYPFLGVLMKGSESVAFLSVAFFIFVAKNFVTFLNAHKVALINADQRGYVLARIHLVFQVAAFLLKIGILLLTQNYILFLLLELAVQILQAIVNGKVVNRRYSYIKTKQKVALAKEEFQSVKEKVKAMFLHNFGGYVTNGTDHLLISAFIGVSTVGIYSNYAMVVHQLNALMTPIMGGIGASVGNLIAAESRDKNYSVFQVIHYICMGMYTVAVIFLFNMINPFIQWWIGSEYLLDPLTLAVILLNFYLMGIRSPVFMFKNKGGIVVEDKYVPLIGSIINLGASLLLLRYFGLAGVFMGTTISILFVFWYGPRLIYKKLFHKPVKRYYQSLAYYLFLGVLFGAATAYIGSFIHAGDSFLLLCLKGIVSSVLPALLFVWVSYRSAEWNYLRGLLLGLMAKRRHRVQPPAVSAESE